MPRVGIVTDSTCDLGPEALAALDVRMVPLTVHIGDRHFADWIDLRPAEFYPMLAAAQDLPTTSQPSPADFTAAYQDLAAQGCTDIVVVTLSSALSGTFESAGLAAASSPVPVRIVDGKSASQGTGLIAMAAAEARDSGMDAAAVEARALEVARSTRLFFLLDTLDYLVKGGRAGKATGLAASLLNIKPVLEVNADGIIEPFKKVRGPHPGASPPWRAMWRRTRRATAGCGSCSCMPPRPKTPRSSRSRCSRPAPTWRSSRTASSERSSASIRGPAPSASPTIRSGRTLWAEVLLP